MTERIIIGGAPVAVAAAAGALICYKKQFGTEYTDDYEALRELLPEERFVGAARVGTRLLWAMAKTADKSLLPYTEWVLMADPQELAAASVRAEALFVSTLGGGKSSGGEREFTSENLIAAALACGLSVSDLDDMPLTMVTDTIEEWCRLKGVSDEARPATQEDFDAL